MLCNLQHARTGQETHEKKTHETTHGIFGALCTRKPVFFIYFLLKNVFLFLILPSDEEENSDRAVFI